MTAKARPSSKGAMYRCPVCGAEIVVLARASADFHPRCCNVDMELLEHRAVFYFCRVCGSEVALVAAGNESNVGNFQPRCCNTGMTMRSA